MLHGLAILIVEDEAFIAIDLADAITDRNGFAIGPVATVAEALALLEQGSVDAAILDANLLDCDVTPVALRLMEMGVAFLIHSATGVPADLAALHPDVRCVRKPARPAAVVTLLLEHIAASRQRPPCPASEMSPRIK